MNRESIAARFTSRLMIAACLAGLVGRPAAAGASSLPTDRFDVAIDLAHGDRVRVRATLSPPNADLFMATGARSDSFSRHVLELRARAQGGAILPVTYDATAPHWHVSVADDAPIEITYDVDLRYLRSLPQWARLQSGFFEGPNLYLVTRGVFVVPESLLSTRAATVGFHAAAGTPVVVPWTPLTGAPHTYTAPFRALANDTVDIGNSPIVRFRSGAIDIEVVLIGRMAGYEPRVRAVAEAALGTYARLFSGTPPARYVFTAALGEEDGQAFDNSGSISTEPPLVDPNKPIWANTIAHELFHFWNGRRIRRADERLTLFTEGFTEYYANLTLLRTGIIDESTYWRMAANHLGAYAYFWYSPNYGIPLIDAGLHKTKNRFGVYDGGWTLALCLDLELRAHTHGRRTLDDLMRAMWRRYGLTRIRYSYADLVETVSSVAGRDYGPFFARYVAGTDDLPYQRDLATIGVQAYTETFGGKAYVAIAPRSADERRAYAMFVKRTSVRPSMSR